MRGAATRTGSAPLDLVFGLFPRLQERLAQRAETLSGGEQQMLAIGRALMTQPRLLMLDEPSQGIAPKLVDDILAAVGRIRALGTTILLVEQRLAEALDLADRAYVLQTGRIVLEGPAKDIAGRRRRAARLSRHVTATRRQQVSLRLAGKLGGGTMLQLWWQMLKETFSDFIADNALSRAAAIAFYTVLSIGPVLLICVAIAGLVFGEEAAQGAMVGQLRGLMGDQAAQMVQSMIASAGRQRTGVWATALGIVTLLLTASGVFGEMQSALNLIWRAEPKASLTTILKARAASLGLVATMGFLMLVSLVDQRGVDRARQLPERDHAGHPGRPDGRKLRSLSFVIVSAMFTAIYKLLPDRVLRWKDVIVGAIATALLFTVGKTMIAIYIAQSAVASSYGAAGALIIVLLWIYYSSVIFLLGSEFTKAWAAHHGSAAAFAARAAATPTCRAGAELGRSR